MKRNRIILVQVGSKIVEAETFEDAIHQFSAEVTGDELLQMLLIDAEDIDTYSISKQMLTTDVEQMNAGHYLDQVIDIMYREPGGQLNPDKRWSPDTLDALGSLLAPLLQPPCEPNSPAYGSHGPSWLVALRMI